MNNRLKIILKWIVPKIAGLAVLAISAIQAGGELPKTGSDWTKIAIGVGLTFASNSLKSQTNEPS